MDSRGSFGFPLLPLSLIMRLLILILTMFSLSSFGSMKVTYEDLQCMTDNIYFEARGEPILGQAMVGHSVLNRVKDKRWPNEVCKVVYQKKQYSWTTEKKKAINDRKAYILSSNLAYTLLANRDFEEPTGVTNYLRCDWRGKVDWWKSMTFLGQIGDHCFYKDD